eukprot:TRINITY_DN1662_c0_g1_i2.p1 TRINITY_DN1662_c0_g1~~TRINITY_DN1662_c0_g1_i2.p1  ORF type:complete len:310 (+),score=74.50 TRINITY_DN1662_c0_g1_i2:1-930(+)
MEATLRNILEQDTLKWVFVGGKGGVGKTTCSCSLAIQLAAVRESVLIVSTDPAHNVSDAFGQKFGKQPSRVNGFQNLYAMEVDTVVDTDGDDDPTDRATQGALADLAELSSFTELMKFIQSTSYSIIVFDTAPTGHTLRLLSFPTMWQKSVARFGAFKTQFAGLFSQVSGMLGMDNSSEDMLLGKLSVLGQLVEQVNAQFKDPERTTFVCVCIPEFLSLYETERMVQELATFGIDSHNIIVNQLLPSKQSESCGMCSSRVKMQRKYLQQIAELYEDFSVVKLPLLQAEVRGVPALRAFSQNLVTPAADL